MYRFWFYAFSLGLLFAAMADAAVENYSAAWPLAIIAVVLFAATTALGNYVDKEFKK